MDTGKLLEDWIEEEYARDLAYFKAEFAKIDPTNRKSLRQWFERYPFLTVHDMSKIAGVTNNTFWSWRRSVGISKPNQNPNIQPPYYVPVAKDIVAPPDADDDWIVRAYLSGASPYQIGRALGRARFNIKRKLRKILGSLRDLRTAVRSTHPCCTYFWVYEHYVTQRLSQTRCAKIAGISRMVFSEWLARFHIRVRSSAEQSLVMAHGGYDLGSRTRPSFRKPSPDREDEDLAGQDGCQVCDGDC